MFSGKDIKIYSSYNSLFVEADSLRIFENSVTAYVDEVYQARQGDTVNVVSVSEWNNQLEKWAISTTGTLTFTRRA